MIKTILAILLLLTCSGAIFSQEPIEETSPINLDDIIQPSPDMAAFMKFVDIPVSYYTGVPEITVPIYTVTNRSLSFPVSLSYHASGVKVDEIASSVGMNWSLYAGGAISRVKRGRADEILDYGFFDASIDEYKPIDYNMNAWLNNETEDGTDITRTEEIINGELFDLEPDVFNYNFPDHSGKFYWNPKKDSAGDFSIVPLEHLIIEKNIVGDKIISWIITDPKGIKYFFEEYEFTDIGESGRVVSIEEDFVSSWVLTKISDPKNGAFIDFEYLPITEKIDVVRNDIQYENDGSYFGQPCYIQSSYDNSGSSEVLTQKIKKIITPNETVEFKYTIGRSDMRESSGCLLDSIIINDNQSNTFCYKLTYELIGSGSYLSKRYFLKEVQKSSVLLSEPAYEFTYTSAASLPPRNSFSQDYWGYYNGVTNSSLIPLLKYIQKYAGFAIRTPDFNYGKYGMISRVTYPTGGYTEYIFEPHDYSFIKNNALTASDYTPTNITSSTQAIYSGLDNSFISTQINIEFDQKIKLFFTTVDPTLVYFTLTDSDGVLVASTFGQASQLEQAILKGTYTLELEDRLVDSDYCEFSLTKKIGQFSTTKSYCGGLRLKTTKTWDPLTGDILTDEYRYKLESDETKSSGSLVYNKPQYSFDFVNSKEIDGICSNTIRVITNQNYTQAGSTMGSHIGYQNVQIFHGGFYPLQEGGNSKNGYTKLTHTSPISHPDQYYSGMYPPLAQAGSNWRHGRLLEKRVFSNDNLLLTETQNLFMENAANEPFICGSKFWITQKVMSTASKIDWNYDFYKIIPQFDYLNKTDEYQYFYDENNILTSTIHKQKEYLYETNYYNLKQEIITENNSDKIIKQYQYICNYGDEIEIIDDVGINALRNLKAFSLPVESITIRQKGEELTTIKANLVQYNSAAKPAFYFSHESSVPTLIVPSYNDNGVFRKSNTYNIVSSVQYDNGANISEIQNRGEQKNALIWGYNNSKVISKVVNATYDKIAYTGFENVPPINSNSDLGNWQVMTGPTWMTNSIEKVTGRQSLGFSGNNVTIFTKNVMPVGTYIVSFWAKGYTEGTSGLIVVGSGILSPTTGDTWKFYTTKYTISSPQIVNITLSRSLIDELRIYPVDAQMTTYTYDPSKGMTSQTDPNGITTFYDYDDFGRLKSIKDNDRNLREVYDYHYKNQ